MIEIWKKLKYPNISENENRFEISSNGRLKNIKTSYIYNLNVLRSGYLSVRTTLGERNNKIHIIIHKAVGYTFLENPNNLPEINHKDGNKLNNAVDNLEWCTSHYNQLHKYTNDLFDKSKISGENNHGHKLNCEQVDFIRKNYKKRDKIFNSYNLSKMFGVSKTTILDIIKNKSWKMEVKV